MGAKVNIGQFHKKLVQGAFQERLSDDDAMLLFCLLHRYEIEVAPGVLNESTSAVAAAITQRHAGEVIASLYGYQKDGDYRADRYHWYWTWNGDWGSYGHAERLTEEETKRMDELKAQLESHPWVHEVREED